MSNNFLKQQLIALVIVSVLSGAAGGGAVGYWIASQKAEALPSPSAAMVESVASKVVQVKEESATVEAVERVSPAVVSIIVTKDLPKLEKYYIDPFFGDPFFDDFFGFRIPRYRQKGTEKREIGGGTGFIVSSDGYIITNKHVVYDDEAEYTVLMNDESKYDAKVLARDPINDLAVLKIEGDNFPTVEWGDSDQVKVGQTVIAIGNALGEFRNTVSKGVISGLARSIVAGGAGFGAESLSDVIQTDASINPGNSGGPLLNIEGQIIGVNTAIAQGAQNIGFAIPANEARSLYENVREHGRIVRPWLGIRYVPINKQIAEKNNLDIDYGALIVRGSSRDELAVVPGSPADKAGLVENDIILEVNGQKIDETHPLNKVIAHFNPGDEITLKILHKGEEKEVKVVLEEMKE